MSSHRVRLIVLAFAIPLLIVFQTSASFAASNYVLRVEVPGTGSVAFNPAGTTCGTNCAVFPAGASVTLTATPAAGYALAGWWNTNAPPREDNGTCAFAGDCRVIMSAARNVGLSFMPMNAPALNIPSTHPRLWYSDPAVLLRAKTWYTNVGSGLRWDNSSAYPYSEPALRSLLSGDTSYCTDVVNNWLISYQVAEDQDPTDNARWFGEEVILVYDWCHEQITPAQRSTLIDRWNAFFVTRNQEFWGGPAMPANNYFWGYLRNSLEWGIATFGENAMAQSFIDEALHRRYENTFAPFALTDARGGVPPEGTAYGAYQLAYPVIPFVTATTLGRPLYDETSFSREAAYYLIYSTTPAPTALSTTTGTSYQLFGWNDDDFWRWGGSAQSFYVGSFMSTVANLWPNRNVGKYARRFLANTAPEVPKFAASTNVAGTAMPDYSALPVDYYASGIGYLFTRNQWGANATSALLQLSQPIGIGGHFHEDFGSFQLWRNGYWISRQSVNYDDIVTGFNNGCQESAVEMLGSNGIVFEGLGPRGHTPPDVYADGPPVVQRLESAGAYSYAVVDLSAIYREHDSDYTQENACGATRLRDDNPYATSVVREFLFVKPLETMIVFDRLQANAYDRPDVTVTNPVTDVANVRKTFLLHFERTPTPETQSVTLNGTPANLAGYVGVNGDQALRVTTLVPGNASKLVVNERSADDFGQFRLEITTSGQAQSYFLHVLQARDAGAANLAIALNETANAYEVRLTHPTRGSATIVFNKGMASSGGSFGYAASGTPTTRALIDHVEPFRVTDIGPQWGDADAIFRDGFDSP